MGKPGHRWEGTIKNVTQIRREDVNLTDLPHDGHQRWRVVDTVMNTRAP
jgi:hypothetical protein